MNLEQMESLCRAYLAQSIQPMAPLEALLSYLRASGGFGDLSARQLEEFLARHPEFEIMPGPSTEDPVTVETFAEAGFVMGPRVILRARVPGMAEIARLLREQVEQIEEIAERALLNATAAGDAPRTIALRDALARAKELKRKLGGDQLD